jgi:CspA family cold shock protein
MVNVLVPVVQAEWLWFALVWVMWRSADDGQGFSRNAGGRFSMATGKVLQFDATRGYGFVTADDGGDDIFLHASVFEGDPGDLIPGLELEFQVMAGDRGRKAYAAHFAEDGSPGQALPVAPARPVAPVAPARPVAPAIPDQVSAEVDDEQTCDVLSETEFGAELTELLLDMIPALTGPQVKEVRTGVVEFARQHGWVDA